MSPEDLYNDSAFADFMFSMGLNEQPKNLIPYDWTESDVRMATIQRSEMEMLIQAERHCVSRQSEIIANQIAQIEELEDERKALRREANFYSALAIKWKVIAISGWVMAAGFLSGAIMLAKELVRR